MRPIRVEIDPTFKRKYRRLVRLGKFLALVPDWVRRIIFRIVAAATSIRASYENEIKEQIFEKIIIPSNDPKKHGYTNPFGDVRAAVNYAYEAHSPEFNDETPGESSILYKTQIRELEALLDSDKDIKSVLNFGVCYAYVDGILASKFPNINFIGIDLSQYTAALNKAAFAKHPNMTFLSGDVFQALNNLNLRGGVLFHSRTCVLLPKDFIEKLYLRAAAAGIKYVVGFEQFGFSRELDGEYTFDLSDKSSVRWRAPMLIHNYPGIGKKCGFDVVKCYPFKTGHTSPDFRVLCYVLSQAANH